MKVVLEGVDGSGKTTVSELLSRRYGWIPYATPPRELRARRTQIDAFASNEEHYDFYRNGIHIASHELSEFPKDKNVVIDRYWLTTYVYHQVMGVQVQLSDFDGIVPSDVTFLLRVSAEEQMRRLTLRGMSVGDVRMLQQQDALRTAYDCLTHDLGLIAIDTDDKSVDQVCNLVLAKLASL